MLLGQFSLLQIAPYFKITKHCIVESKSSFCLISVKRMKPNEDDDKRTNESFEKRTLTKNLRKLYSLFSLHHSYRIASLLFQGPVTRNDKQVEMRCATCCVLSCQSLRSQFTTLDLKRLDICNWNQSRDAIYIRRASYKIHNRFLM